MGRGVLPRRGEWLSLKLGKAWHWLPILEVAHVLSEEKRLSTSDGGADFLHEEAEGVVVSSLALAVRVEVHAEQTYKFVLPPPRWPFGGRGGEEEVWDFHGDGNGAVPENRGPREGRSST